ncbi:MAG: hypothetical protein PHV32_12255 [Eubacteriales bacterium]|nr:hypothetical protein [Eubacteriales bacterium]
MKKLFLLLIVLLILAITAGAAYIYVPKAADTIYSKWVGPWLEIHKSVISLPGSRDDAEGGEEAESGGDARQTSSSIDDGDVNNSPGDEPGDEPGGNDNPGGDASENEKEPEDRIIEAAERIIGNGGLTLSKELLEQLSLEEMLKAYQILQSIDIEDRKEISRIVKKERSPGDAELVKGILQANLNKAELESLYELIVSRDW